MSALVERPAPWALPPEGFHFVVVEADGWQAPAVGAGRCRFVTGPFRKACGRPPVASLTRGYTRPALWDYCEAHLYGRWIEDGKVMGWRLVKDET